jgi:lysyl-tRNA synthetase, class II
MDELEARTNKLNQLREEGIEPYPAARYDNTLSTEEIKTYWDYLGNGESDSNEHVVKVAGRITSIRRGGGVVFIDIQDVKGKLQLKILKNGLESEITFKQLELLDTGDWLGAKGIVCRTNRGELSLCTEELTLLSKARSPFPDTYYGLNDIELCRRHREKDLASNRESLQRFITRSRIIQDIRTYLYSLDFLEVETPILQPIYGGAEAKPFTTHHNALDTNLYLRIAPELYLKRAICGGMEKVFEIGRLFRNEGIDSTHNPEFTSIELYQAYTDMFDMLLLVEDIILHTAKNKVINYQGTEINLEPKYSYEGLEGNHWRIKTMVTAVKDVTGIDFDSSSLEETIVACTDYVGHELSPLESQTKGHLLYTMFDRYVEPTLIEPTFIIEYPLEICPLAKEHRTRMGYAERFELFINGMEFANAFSELNDPDVQLARFQEQQLQRDLGNKEAHHLDKDYIEALSLGMPNCGGMAIGIDRLVMLLTDSQSIRDVILFPTMKPVKD